MPSHGRAFIELTYGWERLAQARKGHRGLCMGTWLLWTALIFEREIPLKLHGFCERY